MILFAIAFVLRALGVDYGYFHGDERINDAAKVLTGELAPGQHFYPPLINYVNAGAFVGLFATGVGLGWWDSIGAFRAQYFIDPTVFYVTARLVTAVFGALLAPVCYWTARRVGLSYRGALVVGLLGALFPLGVYLSHIAKGDVAMATFTVAACAAAIARRDTMRPTRWDILFGVMVVLALSFKQSAVFILAPLAFGHIALLANGEGGRASGGAFLRGIVTVLIFWPILNIGTLLDFSTFLEYQHIQSVMSVRGVDQPLSGAQTLATRAPLLVLGLNPLLMVVTVILPVLVLLPICKLHHKGLLLVIWGALMIGTLAVAFMAGPRQPEHLWIANFAGFALLATLALVGLFEGSGGPSRSLAGLGLALTLAMSLWGAALPVGQALSEPIWKKTDALLRNQFFDARALTMVETAIPITREVQQRQFARWDRLAAKYDVTMPDMAPERIVEVSAPNSQFIMPMPSAMYGLEHVDEDAEGYEVQAHTWPLQPEEWQLDYWLDQDFEVFLVKDLDHQLNQSEAPLMRAFFAEVVDRCTLIETFDPNKPLYLERVVSVFQCSLPDKNTAPLAATATGE
ncbi:phospholipid carrier-dependent glycosyltransferase [Sagittula sp. NFXS13]|uniref:phospholipid carrier-dependent glycosyltransferase n=1 Tax=Sagittula sp. NFXS13 TaxID=2819095 RepID=UPI0032DECC1F